jgi:hypothetical protein
LRCDHVALRAWAIAGALGLGSGHTAGAEPFVSIGRFDADSRAGAELGGSVIDSNQGHEAALDVHAHYVPPGASFGGYVQMAAGYSTLAPHVGVGSLQVGGIYVPELGSETTRLVLHAGVGLPVATGGTGASMFRLADAYGTSGGTSVRIGISPIYQQGEVTVRLDASIGTLVQSHPTASGPAMLLDGAIGTRVGSGLFVAVELSSLVIHGYSDTRFAAIAGLSLRADLGRVLPYVALLTPLDTTYARYVSLGVTAGIDVRL